MQLPESGLPEEIVVRVRDVISAAHLRDVRHSAPAIVFHLTDTAGLRGILTTRRLWASLATTLNDASEVRHGIDLAKAMLRDRIKSSALAHFHDSSDLSRRFLEARLTGGSGEHHDTDLARDILARDERFKASNYDSTLLNYLDDPASMQITFRGAPFLVSFCARPTKSAQWLHYGRSGRGVALGFGPGIGNGQGCDLIKVDYSLTSQQARIKSLINAVGPVLDDVGARFPSRVFQSTCELAALYAALALSTLAAHMKHPSFEDEEEYRLVGHRLSHDGKSLGPPDEAKLSFRTVGDRLVPYEEINFGADLVKEVVLGYSSPVTEGEIGMLLFGTEIQPTVSRSDVPVR